MEIRGKTALVLGAVKGIGKAVGLALAQQGARLVLTRYDWPESFETMEREFQETGADHVIVTADLKAPAGVKKVIETVEKQFGTLDILVNNIERGGWPAVHGEYTSAQWDLEMETTLRAKRWVFHNAYPLLKKSDNAVVINFSSVAGVTGRCGPASLIFNDGYAAAARAVSSLTETWARMGAPGIRVNEIMLGFIETRHAQGTRGWEEVLSESEKKAVIDHILLKRTGTLEDVVRACLFIVKDAPYMTGSILRLDGGYLLGGEDVLPMPPGIL